MERAGEGGGVKGEGVCVYFRQCFATRSGALTIRVSVEGREGGGGG